MRPPLTALAILALGSAVLTSCLQKSLDWYIPADAHEYVDLCVQDIGPDCEALQPTVRTLGRDISVLTTNGDTTEAFMAYARARGLTLEQFLASPLRERYARANIFPVDRFTTGTFTALDGAAHTFVCPDEWSCVMDGDITLNHSMDRKRTGTVYRASRVIFP